MAKQWIFTVLLVIIAVFYSCMGLKPQGVFASLQDQETEVHTFEGSDSGSSPDSTDETPSSGSIGERITMFFSKIMPKRIQLSLSEKSEQILTAWASQQSVHGVINILQTAEIGTAGALSVKPGEGLSPYNNTQKFVSFLYLIALWVIVFCKTILSLSVPVICLVIIPLIIIINIIALWKSKNNTHRIVIAAVVTTLLITIAVPVVIKVSILIDDYIFSKNINELTESLGESQISAGLISADLRSGRRSNAVIQNHTAATIKLSNTAVKDSFSYLLIFTITFILIPVFSGIGLYKLTKFLSKTILKKA